MIAPGQQTRFSRLPPSGISVPEGNGRAEDDHENDGQNDLLSDPSVRKLNPSQRRKHHEKNQDDDAHVTTSISALG